jgi:hypothetical protein
MDGTCNTREDKEKFVRILLREPEGGPKYWRKNNIIMHINFPPILKTK